MPGLPPYNPQAQAPQPETGCCYQCFSDSIGNSQIQKNPVLVPFAPIQLCNANPSRKQLILVNTSQDIVYVGLGSAPDPGDSVTPFAYNFALTACTTSPDDGTGGIWVSDIWQGPVYVSSQGNSGVVNFTELV